MSKFIEVEEITTSPGPNLIRFLNINNIIEFHDDYIILNKFHDEIPYLMHVTEDSIYRLRVALLNHNALYQLGDLHD